MLLSALDLALLIHDYEDWQAKAWHCFRRCEALTLHRRVLREYAQKIAMSNELASLIYQSFPWNGDFRSIGELRDLRQFILEELQKATYIDTQSAGEASLQPTRIVCQYVKNPKAVDAWKRLLCGCVDATVLSQFDPQIATWETPALCAHLGPITLTIRDSEIEVDSAYRFPLVWDEDSWAKQLCTQEWWPDLRRCVELHFGANPAMRNYLGVREQPIPFECTDAFWKSVDLLHEDAELRHRFIKALTKRVYGILDYSLRDEPFKEIRRFRVTDFWRVHYREEDGRLVLEEFGPHSIGGVD